MNTTGEQKPAKRLFLALPVYRNADIFFMQSLMKLQAEQLMRQEFGLIIKMHVGECPIGRARNDLTTEFLQSDATDMLFVDSDVSFSYEQVKKILFHEEDIIGGFYTKKQEGHVSPVCNTLDTVATPRDDGLVQVKYMGTGFLRISRRALEVIIQEKKMDLAYLDDRDGKTVKYDFWRMGVDNDFRRGGFDRNTPPADLRYDEETLASIRQQGFSDDQARVIYWRRWLSEDWQFCEYALNCGFNIWADASILLQHSGMVMFPLRSQLPELYRPEQLQRMGIDLAEFRKDLSTADTAPAFSPVPVGSAETLKVA